MSYRFHTFEEKLEIVQKIKSGIPLRKLSGEYKILMRIIIEWNRRYNLYREDGLVTRNRNQNYSLKQKNEINDFCIAFVVIFLQFRSISDTHKWSRSIQVCGLSLRGCLGVLLLSCLDAHVSIGLYRHSSDTSCAHLC